MQQTLDLGGEVVSGGEVVPGLPRGSSLGRLAFELAFEVGESEVSEWGPP